MITSFEARLAASRTEEAGFTTAELIGNAALGVASLAILWTAIQRDIFPRLLTYITTQLGI